MRFYVIICLILVGINETLEHLIEVFSQSNIFLFKMAPQVLCWHILAYEMFLFFVKVLLPSP